MHPSASLEQHQPTRSNPQPTAHRPPWPHRPDPPTVQRSLPRTRRTPAPPTQPHPLPPSRTLPPRTSRQRTAQSSPSSGASPRPASAATTRGSTGATSSAKCVHLSFLVLAMLTSSTLTDSCPRPRVRRAALRASTCAPSPTASRTRRSRSSTSASSSRQRQSPRCARSPSPRSCALPRALADLSHSAHPPRPPPAALCRDQDPPGDAAPQRHRVRVVLRGRGQRLHAARAVLQRRTSPPSPPFLFSAHPDARPRARSPSSTSSACASATRSPRRAST